MSGEAMMMRRIREKARAHVDSCNCLTCRAADGDHDAKKKLLGELL